jgi:tRNA threonylcarbamoyladenosine biosynthesis protein TsaB
MKILGLSSATKVVSIGLVDDDKLLVETTVADIHSEKLMFYVKEAGIEPSQIDGVAVAAGPGSYAGLRGSLAAAKSIAQTLNVPLTGVSTLEAIAFNLSEVEGTIMVVLDARADEYNCALFGASGGKIKRITDDLVLKLDRVTELLGKIEGEIYLVGNLSGVRGMGHGVNVHFADNIHGQPYGINIAKLGLVKIKAGQIDDPLKLTPQYSHQPNIREFGNKT